MGRDPSRILTEVVDRLSMSTTLSEVTGIVASAARELCGADGATFVLREGDLCYYVDEDAISPLWKGKRFPMSACISGWAMSNRSVVVIADIFQDSRIPHDAYRPTFVKSLCMVPIRSEKPIGAIGNYWADGRVPTDEQVKLLQILANSSAIAIENLELKQELLQRSMAPPEPTDHERELEAAIHILAHDIRNPLSTMILFAEVLKSRMRPEADARIAHYCDSIVRTGRRASQQIQRMLSLYSATRRELHPENVDLTGMARELTKQIQDQSPSRKVQVEIDPDLSAHADPLLIRIALENLFSNAFKYTSKRPDASIRFSRSPVSSGSATFFIRDNGDGFNPDEGSLLFRPLVRLHDKAEFPGVGLGLASVARIIALHGGRVRAEGRKSEGATFYFDLPVE